MKKIVRHETRFWAALWTASAPLTIACTLLVLVIGTATYFSMWASAQLVQSLVDGAASDEVHRWLLITVVAILVQPIASNLLNWASLAHQSAVTANQHGRIAALANGPHGIGHLEDAEQSGKLAGLLDDLRTTYGLTCVPEAWRSWSVRITGIAAVLVIVRWSIIAAALLVALQLVAGRGFTAYLSQVQRDLVEAGSSDLRRTDYLHKLLTLRPAGKEVRLFALTDHLLAWHSRLAEAAYAGIASRRNKAFRPAFASGILVLVGTGACVAWLARDAWNGTVSAAVLVAAIQGITGMNSFGPLGDTSAQAARARTYANVLAELEDAAPAASPTAAVADGAAARVDFTDVSFTYPSRKTPVFQHLSLHIPAGQSVAIVGVNGVGKSTLIKLLSGLYPPSAGSLTVDGADPFTDDATRQRVAVIFQDFVRYHLSLRDNVLLGTHDGTDEQAMGALRSAAALDVLDRVGDLNVPLDPGYVGGTDLSGGQWQRVALARAFAAVAGGAGVLVLDEPTAALDVRVEAEIFEQFLESTRGITTILVSHRLSSVRHADRIVVLGPQGIVEDGSHDELLCTGGEYAQMFTLQASRFNHEEVAQ